MSRRGRPHHEEGSIEGGEINLVPYLDIMVNLIMFMLLTYQVLVELRLISFNPPAAGPGPAPGDKPKEETKMLTVVIYGAGFKLLTSDESAGTELVPKKNNDYDYAGLKDHLKEIKTAVKVDPHLVVVATPDVIYDTVVKTLDAARCDISGTAPHTPPPAPGAAVKQSVCPDTAAELFPDVTLGMAVGSQ